MLETMSNETEFWTWWQGALGLFGVAALSLWLTRSRLGVSGCIETAIDRPARCDEAQPAKDRSAALLLLAGIVLGGFLAGGGTVATSPDPAWARQFDSITSAIAAAVAGGALVGFGTRLSGGCTSGHGLVGCALLSPRSLVATGAFFGTAIGVSLLLSQLGGQS
jgi:uncharacterized membrane protein YedE/YeeE